MPSKLKVLQVIPKLGHGGAEIGCYDLAHYLYENDCSSYIVTSGGTLIKYINRKKVKLIRLPVQSKNPIFNIVKCNYINNYYTNIKYKYRTCKKPSTCLVVLNCN